MVDPLKINVGPHRLSGERCDYCRTGTVLLRSPYRSESGAAIVIQWCPGCGAVVTESGLAVPDGAVELGPAGVRFRTSTIDLQQRVENLEQRFVEQRWDAVSLELARRVESLEELAGVKWVGYTKPNGKEGAS